jgi:hypothetical protein
MEYMVTGGDHARQEFTRSASYALVDKSDHDGVQHIAVAYHPYETESLENCLTSATVGKITSDRIGYPFRKRSVAAC